ncbi:MAG: putative phosphodiesterase [Chlamydiales bacterium]|jgi:predicted phosphodiesterase
MRYGILGDIHSNLSALQTVLDAMDADGVDRILSVGDVVGYGAAPSETIELVRERGVQVVKGNHDAACVLELDITYFNPYAREAVLWTNAKLSKPEIEWLRELPMTYVGEHCCVSHGTLATPERYDYVQTTEDADPSLDEMQRRVCFVGHTHVPVTILRLKEDPSRTGYTTEDEVDLDEIDRALVNVGSVGQPRDEDWRAAYGLYDSEANRVWIKRVDYDIDREAARIRKAGLPDMLADRLFLGV